MFFSDDNTVAHIWCPKAENPLFRARQVDFPDLWPRLDVGGVVELEAPSGQGAQTVSALQLVAAEDV